MSFTYVTPNLLDVNSYHSVSSGDAVGAIYGPANLYNNRSSKPFRFTARDDQWIKLDFGAAQAVTHVSIFNHDLTAAVDLRLQGNAADNWVAPTYDQALTWQEYSLYEHLNESYQFWRLFVDDPTHGTTSLQIGELYFGQHAEFANGLFMPEGQRNLDFSNAGERTYFGQDWDYYLSDCKKFSIRIKNINDPANIDDLETFFRSIGGPAGRFIFIPDDTHPYCYLVKVDNDVIPNSQVVRGSSWESNDWTMTLKTLTRGIRLL